MNPKNLSLLLSTKKRFKILTKQDGIEPFTPNDAQILVLRKILEKWSKGERVRLIIIKGRQKGITTLLQLVQLALVMKVKGYQAYTMAHEKASANDIFEKKIKFAFDNYPKKFRSLYEVNRNNTRQLMFDGDLSKSSVTVGLSARSGTFNFIHISEAGKMSMTPKLYNEMKAGTLEAGQYADAIIFESTPDGGQGEFYQFTIEHLNDPSSEYEVLFLGWFMDSECTLKAPEDQSWKEDYARKARDFDLCLDPMATHGITEDQWFWYYKKAQTLRSDIKTQYPFTVTEGFQSSGEMFFAQSAIDTAMRRIQALESKGITYFKKNGFKIWSKPKTGRRYVVAVDPSTGEGGDNTSIKVFEVETREEVAEATGKIGEKMTAKMAIWVAKIYGGALIAIETNNMGRAVLKYVIEYGWDEDLIFQRYVQDVQNQRLVRVPKLGWETNTATRPVMLVDFRDKFESGFNRINDIETLREMMTFHVIKGKPQALGKFKDDRVLCCMIAEQAIQYVINDLG